MNRLFVYGIFLDETMREAYGMTNPAYMTVQGWKTVGDYIVEAVRDRKATLTGLVVDVNPRAWVQLDRLEGGYNRSKVVTVDGELVYMYTAK